MRKVLLTLAILLLVTSQVARADVSSSPAPADEYFGPYKQSVIEIRNRLNDYDALDPRAMLDPSVGGYLDHRASCRSRLAAKVSARSVASPHLGALDPRILARRPVARAVLVWRRCP